MPTDAGKVNFVVAQAAYYYTLNQVLKLGPTNKPDLAIQDPVRQLKAMNVHFPMRREVDQALEDRFVSDDDPYRRLQIMAEKAEKYATGNCEEASAVAFMFLSKLNVTTVDWCRWKKGLHAFVLVGRRGPFIPDQIATSDWYEDAVICDPQDRRWGFWSTLSVFYPAGNIIVQHVERPGKLRVWVNK